MTTMEYGPLQPHLTGNTLKTHSTIHSLTLPSFMIHFSVAFTKTPLVSLITCTSKVLQILLYFSIRILEVSTPLRRMLICLDTEMTFGVIESFCLGAHHLASLSATMQTYAVRFLGVDMDRMVPDGSLRVVHAL